MAGQIPSCPRAEKTAQQKSGKLGLRAALLPVVRHAAGVPQSRAKAYSPSAAAIWSYLKLASVFTHAGVAASLKAWALHHFHCDPTGTNP